MRRTLKLSLWLPLGVGVLSVIRFGFDPSVPTDFVSLLFSLPAMVFGLVFAWPGGIPLTRALERLHPVSRPATYACAAVLGPLSVACSDRPASGSTPGSSRSQRGWCCGPCGGGPAVVHHTGTIATRRIALCSTPPPYARVAPA